jgi:hypothetical protein
MSGGARSLVNSLMKELLPHPEGPAISSKLAI